MLKILTTCLNLKKLRILQVKIFRMILKINTHLSPKQHLSTDFVEDKDFALSEVGTDIIEMDMNALRLIFAYNTSVIILQNSTIGTKE
jgi:hypothetical protein